MNEVKESIVFCLPFLLSIIPIYMLILVGNKNKLGWLIGLVEQFLWLIWIIISSTWWLFPVNLALWIVYLRNYLKWNKEVK